MDSFFQRLLYPVFLSKGPRKERNGSPVNGRLYGFPKKTRQPQHTSPPIPAKSFVCKIIVFWKIMVGLAQRRYLLFASVLFSVCSSLLSFSLNPIQDDQSGIEIQNDIIKINLKKETITPTGCHRRPHGPITPSHFFGRNHAAMVHRRSSTWRQ